MKHAPRLTALLLILALLTGLLPAASAASQPAEPRIAADSAIVIDYDTGETLYEKDADTMRVPASMTKVMTAYIIFEELEAGNLTLDTLVPISNFAAQISRNQASYPTAVPLPYGGSLTVDTLLRLILIPSASASCVAMAEYISGTEAALGHDRPVPELPRGPCPLPHRPLPGHSGAGVYPPLPPDPGLHLRHLCHLQRDDLPQHQPAAARPGLRV